MHLSCAILISDISTFTQVNDELLAENAISQQLLQSRSRVQSDEAGSEEDGAALAMARTRVHPWWAPITHILHSSFLFRSRLTIDSLFSGSWTYSKSARCDTYCDGFLETKDGPYDNFNMLRAVHGSTCRLHFHGFGSTFDEILPKSSPLIAPYRTRTRRPMSSAMEATKRIVAETNRRLGSLVLDSSDQLGAAREEPVVDIKLRCFWLSAMPGAGVVRMLVPCRLCIANLLAEYCAIMQIPATRMSSVSVCVIDSVAAVQHAVDSRFESPTSGMDSPSLTTSNRTSSGSFFSSGSSDVRPGQRRSRGREEEIHSVGPGIRLLRPSCTLWQEDIESGCTLDILYAPSREELKRRRKGQLGVRLH